MPDLGLKALGSIIPGARNSDPATAGPQTKAAAPTRALSAGAPERATPAAVTEARGPASPPKPALFSADVADDRVALASEPADAPLELLAATALHSRTQTPFSIGIIGRPGSGKSVALNKLVQSIERLALAARGAKESPYLGEPLIVRLDASDLEGPAVSALAGALHARLVLDAPALAAEASHAARDPGLAAREAFERLDGASRKLQSERRIFEEAETRRARLVETVLYETPGSKVDADAARRRGRIVATLSRFCGSVDPTLAYKDMIRTLVDARGPARLGFIGTAFWGLKGQARLIFWAATLALLGFGLGAALEHQASWIDWLRRQQQMSPSVDWIEAHLDWLATLRAAAYGGAAIALVVNAWRGARLLQLIFRGEHLLELDVAERRREGDAFLGHQSRRVQDLSSEVERLSRRAAEAERRAGGHDLVKRSSVDPSPFAGDLVKQQTQRFVAAVGTMVTKRAAGDPGASAQTPQRIILAFDNLDMTTPDRALELLRLAPGEGYVSLIAIDPTRLRAEGVDVERFIAAPLAVGELAARRDPAEQLRALLDGGAAKRQSPAPAPNAAGTALDEPLDEKETQLLAALAPVLGPTSGGTARGLKRFANLYRLVRAQAPESAEQRAALALALALECAGATEDFSTLETAIIGLGAEPAFDHHRISPRLALALQALAGEQAHIGKEDLRQAIRAARLFSFRA